MRSSDRIARYPFSMVILTCWALLATAQQPAGQVGGRVVDQFGAIIVGASVTLTNAEGIEKKTTTNGEGVYEFSGLAPAMYTLRVAVPGFALYQKTDLMVLPKNHLRLNVTLGVTIEKQEVTIQSRSLSTESENNASQIVLRDKELDALPDDPDELAAALQALAGPSSGPNGGDIYVDGFLGTRVPPKTSIREVRINQNTFSAEYDRVGFGRVEILTKPGTDKFRGQAFFNFNDASLNSRNPFSSKRAQHQSRLYGGNLSGPISVGKASFFLDFERREISDNALINAAILDAALNPTRLNLEVPVPQRRMTFSPRFDYQLSRNNTLVARYSFLRGSVTNAGVGNFSLLSRAFSTSITEQTIQLTETAVIHQKAINETRFQFINRQSEQLGDLSTPSINVVDAFAGGGPQIGKASNDENRWEFQNYTTWTIGHHVLKAGGRLRGVRVKDLSRANFVGTYTFAGTLAPDLDANNQVVHDSAGQPVMVSITSLERYRRTLLFQQAGLSPTAIRALGGGAAQFSIAGGDPVVTVGQIDFGGFLLDDWRLRPNLNLSLGLRYETQTNIKAPLNFAPRLTVAWAPFPRDKQPTRTVIRAGFGIFYDRFSENLTLQADRFDGSNQQQFVVNAGVPGGHAILDLFPNVPLIGTLSNVVTIPQTKLRVSSGLRTPYTMQSVVSLERQLPLNFTFSATFNHARSLHLLRSRNINAPLPGTFDPLVPGSGVHPLGNTGNVFEFESSGRANQKQLILTLRNRFNQKLTIFANYALGKIESDTDGPQSFPANQYDLSGEYGRSPFDIRHRFFLGGSIGAPWGINLDPFIVALSGRPFNIITGRDSNGDTLFTERPAIAASATMPGVVLTRAGVFDLSPAPGQIVIPHNFGSGPNFFAVSLRVSKVFAFVDVKQSNRTGRQGPPEKRYGLTFSVQAQNLLNRTNAGVPIGNLSSPFFGTSTSLDPGLRFVGGVGGAVSPAANRRIEVQVRFNF